MRNVSSPLVSICLAGAAAVAATSATAQDNGGQSACSGILCLFGSRPAAPSAEASPPGPQATETDAPPSPGSAATDGKIHAKPTRPPKPIVIAADLSERTRLELLLSIIPKQTVKIIDAEGNGSKADFSTSMSIDQRDGPSRVKLFTEQMHIVAGDAIHSVNDLKGKVVSFGTEHSASQIAARKAFAALDIPVKETPLDLENALDGLASGDIAAVVLLSPRPDERLRRVAAPGLHLVTWPDKSSLPEGAVISLMDGVDYPALAKPGEAVRVLGFDAVLVLNPKEISRSADRKFLAALSRHSAQLSTRGFDLLRPDPDHRVATAERR